MIASLRGRVTSKTGATLVVEVGGIGYEVFVPAAEFGSVKVSSEIQLLIHEHLREDAHTLYGFTAVEAKHLFELLLGVNGVGPKVALAILSAASLEQLQTAIAAGDAALLRGVAGVGTKTAQRVMLELRGKLDAGEPVDDPTFQALISLGYAPAQAAMAVTKLPATVTDDQQRIKLALKELAK